MYDIADMSEEFIKCYSDKTRIYMIEHFLKTYDATQRKEVPYKLFPRQKIHCQTLGSNFDTVTEKPRQAGVTTTTAAFMSCEIVLADPESPITILCIGNTLDLAQQMVTKIRDFLNQFPRWLFGEEYWDPDPKSEKNKKKIFELCNQKELKLTNGCRVVARSSGPDASRGVGGVTWLIFDEAAFIENGNDVYASAVATVSTGGHIVMISTPNGKDQLYYKTCRQASEGTNGFKLVQFKWYQDPRYNKYLKWTRKNETTGEREVYEEPLLDEKGNIEYNEAHWEEMVRNGWKPTSPWYTRMCGSFNNDAQKIAQELDVSFLGSSDNVVDPEYIEMQEDLNVRQPNPEFKDETIEETWVWKLPEEGHRYILCIDNSRGDSEDATALEIIDLDGIDDNGMPCIEQVLEYSGKLFGDTIGEIANRYGRYYNNAFCVVESIGGYGDATLLTLLNLQYPSLYYDDAELNKYTMQGRTPSFALSSDGKLPGFHSNAVRFQMLSNFANLVRTNQFKIRSKRVINELETWIYKNGKMDHMDGCHDDTLTCLAMGLFVMQYSMNRQIKAKSKDEMMMRAMIDANAPIKRTTAFAPQNKNNAKEESPKYHIPIMVSPNIQCADHSSYKASMWLLK